MIALAFYNIRKASIHVFHTRNLQMQTLEQNATSTYMHQLWASTHCHYNADLTLHLLVVSVLLRL